VSPKSASNQRPPVKNELEFRLSCGTTYSGFVRFHQARELKQASIVLTVIGRCHSGNYVITAQKSLYLPTINTCIHNFFFSFSFYSSYSLTLCSVVPKNDVSRPNYVLVIDCDNGFVDDKLVWRALWMSSGNNGLIPISSPLANLISE
jgi:hypothetical protein